MKKTLLTLVCALLTLGSVVAKPVDVNTARRVATHFWNAHRDAGVDAISAPMKQIDLPFDGMYLFAAPKGGFVFVAAEDCVTPILGYSFTSPVDSRLNPEVRYWLGTYQQQIEALRQIDAEADSAVASQWVLYNTSLEGDPIPLTTVSPLITTTWGQQPYYNDLCPYDSTAGSRAITGCVATATAQVMKYWNHPLHGTGSHSYLADNYGILSANFTTATYDWANMPSALSGTSSTAEVKAVATLMYHVGVAMEMRYGVNWSGAFTVNYGIAGLPCAQNALLDYFGYQNNVVWYARNNYSDTAWASIVLTELNSSRPVIYDGADTSGGHCFICDGYNNNNQFHFNWGWNGYCDGYYTLSNLAPSAGGAGGNASSSYNLDQNILTGVYPDPNYLNQSPVTPDPSCLITSFPYIQNFEDTNSFQCLSVFDANGDNDSWGLTGSYGVNGSNCAFISYAYSADDYFVFPSIVMPGNYTVTWKARAYDADWPESYEVYAGGNMIFSETLSDTLYVTRTASFTVDMGDTVPLMFRYISDDEYYFFIDDITIAENAPTISISGPDIVPSGEMQTFTATVTNSSMVTWTFAGATPSTATGFTASATWNNGGTYNVIATATNALGSASDTLVITVVQCSPITTFPYTLTFEANDIDQVNCWTTLDVDGDGYTWTTDLPFGITGYLGSESFVNGAGALTPDNWFISPQIHLSANANYTLSWATAAASSSYYAEHYGVYVSTSGTDPSNFTSLQEYTLTTNNLTTQTLDLSAYSGQTIRIAFRHWNVTDELLLVLDNITISETTNPNPGQTYTLTVNSNNNAWGIVTGGGTYNSGATATLTATANSGYHFVAWQDGNTANPRTVTVTANATYTATFAANAAPTNCDVTSLPWNYSFITDSISDCWTNIDADGDSLTWTFYPNYGAISFSYITDGQTWEYSLTPDDWLISPKVTLPASGADFHYTYLNVSAEYPDHIGVFVSTTNTNPSSFTLLEQYTAVAADTTWHTRTVSLAAYAGQQVYIAIRHYNSDDEYAFVVGSVSVTAGSTPMQYTITVNSNNNAWGTVTGGGTYNSGATATLTATANSGYHFVSWQDGNTTNPRTVTVTANATYTATFEADVNCPPVATFPYNESFDGSMNCWTVIDGNNDGNSWILSSGISGGSSTITPHSGTGMAASFSWNGSAINANEYLVSPQFVLPAGQTITLSWWFRVNGSYPEDKLAVKVSTTGNAVSNFTTTLFDIIPTSVHGDWTQQTIDLSAYAGQSIYLAFHHHDSYDANYLLVDDIQIAVSAPAPTQYTITASSNNNAWGTVTGGGTYNSGATVTLTATANSGYHFVSWQDGNTANPRTVTVTGDATYIATFEANAPEPTQYTITVLANNSSWGNVTGGGTYPAGATVTISAMSYSGYQFVSWQDGDTQASRTVTVTEDATYIATFAENNGIEEIEGGTWEIYPNPATDQVVLRGIPDDAIVTVLDLSGRKLLERRNEKGEMSIDVSTFLSGTYFVRVVSKGNVVVKKLIVE